MSRIITPKTFRLYCASIIILMSTVFAPGQPRQRVLEWPSRAIQGNFKAGGCGALVPTEISALEIVEINVAGKSVMPGQAFAADENWLQTLALKVRNISGKPISLIRISFNLPEATYEKASMGFSLIYGNWFSNRGKDNIASKVILPGEEVVLARDETQYDRETKAITQKTGKTDFTKAVIGITTVRFEDGMNWTSGKLPLRDQKLSGEPKASLPERNGGHRISGVARLLPDGQPVAKAIVQIRSLERKADGLPLYQDCVFTDNEGRWMIENVPEGDLHILVNPSSRHSPANQTGDRMHATIPVPETEFVPGVYHVKMAGADIADLKMQLNKGGKISGTVVMEGDGPLPDNLIVLPEQTAATDRAPSRFAPVQPDGSFTLTGVPTGNIQLKVTVYGKPREYRMKSVTIGDTELPSQDSLRIEDGTEIKNVRILFARSTEK